MTHDVVVVGGGPAGIAVASTLHRAGVDVVVVDGGGRTRPWIAQSAPPGTDRVVCEVVGASAFDANAHLRALGNRSAWGSTQLVLTDFMFNPFGTGWHLDRGAFDERLIDTAEHAGVTVMRGHTVVASERRPDRTWTLTFDAGNSARAITARVVCDASGRRATIARAHGATTARADQLVAVTAVAARAHDDDDLTSTVQAVPDGWWYTAPVPGDRRAFAFFTDADRLDRSITKDAGAYALAMHAADHVAALAPDMATSTETRQPSVYAAGTRVLSSVVGPGWIAAGDAAATFDPLSSQGILTALLTGREGAHTILRLLEDDRVANRAAAARDYTGTWDRVIDEYDREHAAWFAAEHRFGDRPFWARRRTRTAA